MVAPSKQHEIMTCNVPSNGSGYEATISNQCCHALVVLHWLLIALPPPGNEAGAIAAGNQFVTVGMKTNDS